MSVLANKYHHVYVLKNFRDSFLIFVGDGRINNYLCEQEVYEN